MLREDSPMQKLPLEKVLPIVFYALLIAGLGLIGYVGMSRRAGAPPFSEADNQAGVSAQAISLAVCEESSEKLCVLSTGYDAEGNLLVSLKTTLLPMPTVYGVLRSQKMEIRLDCELVDISPRLLYCLGPFAGDLASVEMELYEAESGVLLASGVLVPGEMALVPVPTLAPVPTAQLPGPTQTPVSYPGATPPSYPPYPSYP